MAELFEPVTSKQLLLHPGAALMNQIGLVETAGIIVVLALIAWQVVFFQVVRPRIMVRIGRWLNVDVHESPDAWDAGIRHPGGGAPS